jgi:c-di-GMP-binding flagellar brake protein YcgR
MGVSSIDNELPTLARRKYQRTSVQQAAMIIIASDLPPIRCTVIDISAAGAGLWVGSTFGIPSTFKLLIDDDPTLRACRVARIEPHKLGVEFQ